MMALANIICRGRFQTVHNNNVEYQAGLEPATTELF